MTSKQMEFPFRIGEFFLPSAPVESEKVSDTSMKKEEPSVKSTMSNSNTNTKVDASAEKISRPIVKAFILNGDIWIRCTPVKQLFRSNMVHNVVNRGDYFAVNTKTGEMTIIPGKLFVIPIQFTVPSKVRTGK